MRNGRQVSPQSVRKRVPVGYLWAPRMPLVVVRVKVWDSQCEHANMPPPPHLVGDSLLAHQV